LRNIIKILLYFDYFRTQRVKAMLTPANEHFHLEVIRIYQKSIL
jgi:hypothetical protein